eukprot:8903529-Ditylum_brightwellii.AAC.1
MLKREAEVKDEDDALEWKVEKKIDIVDDSLQGKQQQQLSLSPSGEIIFDNVTFRYKTRSQRKALGSSLADLAGQKRGGGGGREGGRGHGGAVEAEEWVDTWEETYGKNSKMTTTMQKQKK